MKTYTFHISLPGFGRVWRKLELPSEATLEGLHLAIQDAFEFDNAHLYSFFMSGKAWDPATEYSLPEDSFSDADDEMLADEDDEGADSEDADISDLELPEELTSQIPAPEQILGMLDALRDDPVRRDEFSRFLQEQAGVPGFLVDMVLDNPALVASMMAGLPGLSGGAGRDVRATTLDSLQLEEGKEFLYLFDYGDEWQFRVKVSAINENADPDADYPLVVEAVGDAPEQYGDIEDEESDEDE